MVANNTLYITGSNKYLYAFDAETGILKWVFEDGGVMGSDPCVIDVAEHVYNTSYSGNPNR